MQAKQGPRALVILAPGAEEMEVTIVVDVLRRADVAVVLAGLDGVDPVTCSRGVRILPDAALARAAAEGPFDLIVLPGGSEGARRLAESKEVGRLLREQEEAKRAIGAICAAPVALIAHNVGAGRAMTCHPSVRDQVAGHALLRTSTVVEDGKLITSRGPGTSFDFALALVTELVGPKMAQELRKPMLLPEQASNPP